MIQILTNLITSVVANVLSDYIRKWLDSDS